MSAPRPDFRYTPAAQTAKPGYLHRKWSRLYPGCFKPQKPRPPVPFRRRIAEVK